MSAPVHELIEECARLGIHLEPAGDRLRWQGPKGALSAELAERLKEHKIEVIRALGALSPLQQEALDLLDRDPGLKYGIATDPDSEPDKIIVAVAVRDVGVVNLHIPKTKWDPWLFMAMLERQRKAN